MSKENRSRAAKLSAALRLHYDAESEGYDSALRDLLTDARHLCDIKQLSYADADRMAQQHYSAERYAAKYGDKRDYPKIDIYTRLGHGQLWRYCCSSTWSRTCREAKEVFTRKNSAYTESNVKACKAKVQP